ncbi:flavin reductase family protein [Nocardioides currus]|uniref:Flavin reductase n=1 Tax=Nocardioides currus TaxID=2133958 RepID=A0A2R7YW38_9ACTN|nr:flavin reductase family protein [Nocardioides currus]PUA80595.1 flavin reductase [Nocardioides currus]
MTIHSDHPFATPEGERDAARRLRGRVGGQVSLWTAGTGGGRVGLTVSSWLVAVSEPSYVLGLLDPDSDLGEALRAGPGARCVVQLLEWGHRDLAEKFAGQMPAPGGLFAADEWHETPHGPRLATAPTWAGCVVHDVRELGWSLEVTCRIDEAVVGAEDAPLQHRRGRYQRPDHA